MTDFKIPDFIKEETRKRCAIFRFDDAARKKLVGISPELFHFLYEIDKLTFTIYIRIEEAVIEFIKPQEFSKTLLDQVGSAMHATRNVELLISRHEQAAFDLIIDNVRAKKMQVLLEKDPDLDRKVLSIFSDMSNTSQLVVRGGLTEDVIKRVKSSAAHFVNNFKDNEGAIVTLSRMIIHDPTLYDHSASVAMISGMIALQCVKTPLGRKDVELVTQSGLYHDVGKTCIPSLILNKPGKFTPEEFEVMKTHAALGEEEMLRVIENGAAVDFIVARVAGEHHERFDGGGYPRGRKGRFEESSNGIHLFTRIVTIADVYSALLMKRVYKPAYEAQDAIKLMAGLASKEYDPEIFRKFLMTVVGGLNQFQEKVHGKDKGRILYLDEAGDLREKKSVVI